MPKHGEIKCVSLLRRPHVLKALCVRVCSWRGGGGHCAWRSTPCTFSEGRSVCCLSESVCFHAKPCLAACLSPSVGALVCAGIPPTLSHAAGRHIWAWQHCRIRTYHPPMLGCLALPCVPEYRCMRAHACNDAHTQCIMHC